MMPQYATEHRAHRIQFDSCVRISVWKSVKRCDIGCLADRGCESVAMQEEQNIC